MIALSSKFTPAAVGPYSQAIEHSGLIYLSGMLPIKPETNQLVNSNIAGQTEQVLTNIKLFLEDQGVSLHNVVKTTIYLTSMNDFEIVNSIYSSYFSIHRPARSCVEVSALPKGALIEIEAIVAKE
ncbi:Rid family detoxifying hydrolase [Sporosarcina obsidiansis]|uniref:Rid family detoxifying hydrolase n=1 Tax=Sporosarcina obsidiansis TaxID=2660748 RepID=UPI00129BAB22|nr:Rid family detoxifying hydrolase [Sporosarcina obsidiansis]